MGRAMKILSVALVLALALPAVAQDNKEQAREHFKSGQTHYALGEFTEAVTEFREAYRLQNQPGILFNIAQAMRQLGQFKQAYFYYSQYLHQRPDAANRAEVENFMGIMKKKLDADEEVEHARAEADAAHPPPARFPEDRLTDAGADEPGKKPPAGQGKAVAVAGQPKAVPAVALKAPAGALASTQPAPGPAAEKSSGALRYVGFAALGVGALAEGMAFVFHSSAQSAADQLNQKYAAGTLEPSDAHLKSDVESKGQLATLSAIGGAVLLVTGGALSFVF